MNPASILLAEDDPDFRLGLGTFLHKHGYAVIAVEDGDQALEFAVSDAPDLMILDVHMPAGDGFGVHERVARHPELAFVPVVYMTHDLSHEVEWSARQHGAFALLHKPFTMEILLQTIRAALAKYRSGAA